MHIIYISNICVNIHLYTVKPLQMTSLNFLLCLRFLILNCGWCRMNILFFTHHAEICSRLRFNPHFTLCSSYFALPLCFACSLLGVEFPESCRNKGLGWSVLAKWPFKWIFSRGTFQTEGMRYALRIKWLQRPVLKKLQYISVNKDFFLITTIIVFS